MSGFHVVEILVCRDHEIRRSMLVLHVIIPLVAGSPWEEVPLPVGRAPPSTLVDYIPVHSRLRGLMHYKAAALEEISPNNLQCLKVLFTRSIFLKKQMLLKNGCYIDI